MAPECSFILATGRKCRGTALRHQPFCRHHGPQPYIPPQRNPFTALRKWRSLGQSLHRLHPAEIPFAIYEILDSLTGRDPDNRLSDLIAGRYLRALLAQIRCVPFPRPAFPPPAAAPAPLASAHAQPPSAPIGPRAVPRAVHPPAASPAPGGLAPELRSAVQAFLANPNFTDGSLETLLDAFTQAGYPPPEPSPSSRA